MVFLTDSKFLILTIIAEFWHSIFEKKSQIWQNWKNSKFVTFGTISKFGILNLTKNAKFYHIWHNFQIWNAEFGKKCQILQILPHLAQLTNLELICKSCQIWQLLFIYSLWCNSRSKIGTLFQKSGSGRLDAGWW